MCISKIRLDFEFFLFCQFSTTIKTNIIFGVDLIKRLLIRRDLLQVDCESNLNGMDGKKKNLLLGSPTLCTFLLDGPCQAYESSSQLILKGIRWARVSESAGNCHLFPQKHLEHVLIEFRAFPNPGCPGIEAFHIFFIQRIDFLLYLTLKNKQSKENIKNLKILGSFLISKKNVKPT